MDLIDQIGGWRSITSVGAGYGDGYDREKVIEVLMEQRIKGACLHRL